MNRNLSVARQSLDVVIGHMKDRDVSEAQLTRGLLIAQVNAVIAQAEQLERIADMLSIYLNDYDPNGNEAQGVTTEDIGY